LIGLHDKQVYVLGFFAKIEVPVAPLEKKLHPVKLAKTAY
jgi:hypothetical protein